MIKTITKCRICGNTDLEFCIDLGEQVLTGFFQDRRTSLWLRGL